MYLAYSTWFEIAALAVSLWFWRQLKSPFHFFLIIPFLLITVAVEITASYIGPIYKANRFIYNFYDIVFFGFFLYVIFKDVVNKKLKTVAKFFLISFLLFGLLNFMYFQGFDIFNPSKYLEFKFNKYTYITGATLVILSSLLYYFDQILLISLKRRLEDNLIFWIATAGLFYCAGSILSASLHEFIVSNKIMMHKVFLTTAISRILSILLYSILALGVYMHATKDKRNQKKTRKMEEESAKDAREIEELRNAILK
jgi:hypothetical protein